MKKITSHLWPLLVFMLIFKTTFASESLNLEESIDLFTPKQETNKNIKHEKTKSKNIANKKDAEQEKGSTQAQDRRHEVHASTIESDDLKDNFTHSVALLTLFFHNGVIKTGYAVLIKNGYMITTANLITEPNSYVKTIRASMQNEDNQVITCVAKLRPKALDNKLALLEPENYTDKFCNIRPKSFFHQRIIVKYAKSLDPTTTVNKLILKDYELLSPLIHDNYTMGYQKTNISKIQHQKIQSSLPIFSKKGEFIGFINNENNQNYVLSSDYINDFICNVTNRKLISISDLNRKCI